MGAEVELVTVVPPPSSSLQTSKPSTEDDDATSPHTTPKKKLLIGSALISLSCIALVTLLHSSSREIPSSPTTSTSGTNRRVGIDGVSPPHFHQSGFGGASNMAHLDPHRQRRSLTEPNYTSSADVHIPISKVARSVKSLNKANILNRFGHYAHDEHQSPYASYLYQRPQKELEQEQVEYVAKMAAVRKEWGSWNFIDQAKLKDDTFERPVVDLGKDFEYKDYMYTDLDEKAWQRDDTYVTDLLREANNLVDRVTEGIYAEYGHPTKQKDGSTLTPEETQERNKMFGIDLIENDKQKPDTKGAAWMTQRSSEFLSRKLLHAMLTNDDFFVIMGGHSAAAGHGNNFMQEYMMSFHYLMEPVMQKLGIRLVSRNLAMGGLGTLHFGLGAGTLYGESDFMIWDSSMTEREAGNRDLFNKQALLSGERVPLIFTNSIFNLEEETGGLIAHGDFGAMNEFIPTTVSPEQALTLPFATRFMKCSQECDSCNHDEKYHSTCWVDRSDVEPNKQQASKVGGGASWHPGNRSHHRHGRKIALTMLHGLKNALTMWEEGIKKDGFPLNEKYWHVGDSYKTLQANLEASVSDVHQESECEKRFTQYPRACRIPMFGMGEYSPKALDDNASIRHHIVHDGPDPLLLDVAPNMYSGVDLFPLMWKIPHGEVDVHAIAIATNYLEASLNDEWVADKGGSGTGRKLLRDVALEEKKATRSAGVGVVPGGVVPLVADDNNAGKIRQTLANPDEIVPGKGWISSGPSSNSATAGFCDGSANSECQRQETSTCLAANTNDHRAVISGDNLSGWLVIQIPKLVNGLILARMEWWHPMHSDRTVGWTEVNNGGRRLEEQMNNTNFNDFATDESTSEQRQLKAHPPPLVDDFEFDIAIDGEITKTWNATQFRSLAAEISYNEAIFPLYDRETTSKVEGVQLALRVRGNSLDPKAHRAISITHIYYG